MTQAKQFCLGVAAAGIFGIGATLTTAAVAHADPATSDNGPSSSASSTGSSKAGPRVSARTKANVAKTPRLVTAAAVRTPAKQATGLVPMPQSPLPVTPVSPAGAISSTTSTATGRSRNVAFAATTAAAAQIAEPVLVSDPTKQHVLLIGIDGTNLSAILADDFNQNLFELMNDGTTAASTIIGHTTISNPSWTGILTGVWGETAGVSNNVFTPSTYDTWPTIFNQLETYNSAINTTAIADWPVIAQIAGAGSIPADKILYYPKINDSWLDTDDAVGAASVDAILNTAAGTPSFQFTYFVGVDDTGHEYDAGSPQYADAIRNVDINIGEIMDAIDTWETDNPGEEWTVIAVTDHGQVPWPTIRFGSDERAHGFQTPWETTTFVIADGPDFEAATINNTYVNIDVTPTISKLFGIAPEPYSQGKPLMDRSAYDYQPLIPGQQALHDSLNAAISMYGYPDVATNIAMIWRTLAVTVPYAILTVFESLAASVPDFLVLPIQFIGAIAYNIANIPAQIVARITGVTGNSILPEDWWPYNPVPGTQTEVPNPAAAVTCSLSLSACLAS